MKRILIMLLFVFIQHSNSKKSTPKPLVKEEWVLVYQDEDVTIYHSSDIEEKEFGIPITNMKVYRDLVAHYRNKSEEFIKFE